MCKKALEGGGARAIARALQVSRCATLQHALHERLRHCESEGGGGVGCKGKSAMRNER